MVVTGSIAEVQQLISQHKYNGHTIGFVPTMGALHQGHVSLVKEAAIKADVVVCSIYVNPTQFNNADDLKSYPRNVAEDSKLLAAHGCEILFLPSDEVMYSKESQLTFEFGEIGTILEGEFRPGHFSGVALVVSKLFNIIQPNLAFFGQKDLQQLVVIKQLVSELLFNIDIVKVPIMREEDGLAMSSRNQRLSSKERKQAVIFHQALTNAKLLMHQEVPLDHVKAEVTQLFQNSSARLEYFEVVNDVDLQLKKENYLSSDTVLCIAGFIGNVRLIDNMYLIS